MYRYTSMLRYFVLITMTGALAAGCELRQERPIDPDLYVQALDGGSNCPPEECGLNGTVLAEARFGQLSLDGEPNEQGMAIVDFVDSAGHALMLDIVNSQFQGVEPATGAIAAVGDQLPGSRIIIEQTLADGTTTEWALIIEDTGSIGFLSDELGTVPTYYMYYAPVGSTDPAQPLCENNAAAALIAGERYDADTLAIDAQDSERWFRLACEGHILWKAKRMSYDPERSPGDAYATTATQRRATLAMIAADYCGTGERFTTPGTAIYWQNQAHWMVHGAPPASGASVEAGWDQHGATCLDTPRHSETYPRADIEAACGRPIPTCTPDILDASEWVTWLP